jgi:hypothetical protein
MQCLLEIHPTCKWVCVRWVGWLLGWRVVVDSTMPAGLVVVGGWCGVAWRGVVVGGCFVVVVFVVTVAAAAAPLCSAPLSDSFFHDSAP